MEPRLLLDTNALLAHGGAAAAFPPAVRAIVARVQDAAGLMVSPISAWELAMASRGKPKPDTLAFRGDPLGWWRRYCEVGGVALASLTPEIAFDAYLMPEPFHTDPADRMLVATARSLRCPIVTSDAKIIAYAAAGHVMAIGF